MLKFIFVKHNPESIHYYLIYSVIFIILYKHKETITLSFISHLESIILMWIFGFIKLL